MAREVNLKELLQELAEERNFDFRGYKPTTLDRRFRRRMFQLNLGSYAEYAEYIRQHSDEIDQLLNTILINVTEFFRDPPAWELLRNELWPLVSSMERRLRYRRGTLLNRHAAGGTLRKPHPGL
jgi:two-component system CheB/CheR fusion protein